MPAVDPVHYDKPIAGVGPGRSFALAIAARDVDARIGLVPAAVGGSPISSWEPGCARSRDEHTSVRRRLVRARAALKDGTLRGFSGIKVNRTRRLSSPFATPTSCVHSIARFRSDLGAPNVPFIIGQLGQFAGKPWTDAQRRVDSAQRAIAASVPNVAYVSSDGLRDKGDTVHFDAAAARDSDGGTRRRSRDSKDQRLQRPAIADQRDPGRAGNGVAPQPEPYNPPAEIERRLSEAPEGTLSDVAYFPSKSTV